jgi:hypothetical protein
MPARRYRQFLMALTITLSPLVLPASSQATVKSVVKIRWVGDRPSPAQAGREFAGQLEVVAPKAGKLENVQIRGTGWSLEGFDGPSSLMMERGGRRLVSFRATPSDATQPLTVRATFDGVTVEKSLALDAASLQKRRLHYQNASGPLLSGSRPKVGTTKLQRTQDQQIAFQGDFKYTREDGVVLGADHIKIRIWDDDGPIDEVIWSGETDANGHFQGAVSWDDCDISGCDDPDVYVEVIASTDACDLQADSILEETYTWESPVIDNFTGTFIDFGTMTPGPQNDVVHVFNTVTRAHRFAANRGGMSAPAVDVQFPDGGSNSRYDTQFGELHIVGSQAWDEVIATHEYGHYLNDTFGNLLEPDYENGFCDTPDPGHCLWCPEGVGEGWQEGFADWYGQLVVEAYPSDYGQTPWVAAHPDGVYGVDGLDTCQQDDTAYPDGKTEGYVMALLRDIQDGTYDNHSGGTPDCTQDAMSLGYDEILTVFRDDDPTDIGMFINSFRARYPQHDMDLWSTTQNVGPTFSFPLPDPVVVSQPPSCSIARVGETLAISVTGNGSLLQYQWRANGSNLSNGAGIIGATTPTLTLSPLSSAMGATYDCVVSTCDGSKSVTSSPTRVTVFDAPESARPHLTWGENIQAQCGDGTTSYHLEPGSHTGLSNVVQADGGRSYSMALRADGTVYTWGAYTEGGELGNGFQYSTALTPTFIGLSNVVQIAAGNSHALALLRSGNIVGWGYNFYGQLGDQTQVLRVVLRPPLIPDASWPSRRGITTHSRCDPTEPCGRAGTANSARLETGRPRPSTQLPSKFRGSPMSSRFARWATRRSRSNRMARCGPGDTTSSGRSATAAASSAIPRASDRPDEHPRHRGLLLQRLRDSIQRRMLRLGARGLGRDRKRIPRRPLFSRADSRTHESEEDRVRRCRLGHGPDAGRHPARLGGQHEQGPQHRRARWGIPLHARACTRRPSAPTTSAPGS